MAPTIAKHDEWTLADVEALDVPDWWRYQIVDGSLVVSPAAGNYHERLAIGLRALLADALPAGLVAGGPLSVRVGRSYLIPDILVVSNDRLRDPALLEPADVSLVVEIVSPGSVSLDRLVKPAKYAAAGIANFWRVEIEPMAVTAYTLDGEAYRELGTWGAGETARIDVPFPVTIEVDRLA